MFFSRSPAIVAAILLGACGGSGSTTTSVAPTGNRAPSISGNPPDSVVVGDSYAFTPQSADADGDTLQFSVQNLPGWTNFNDVTGTIAGTPTMADIATYSDIVVSVSDGMQTSSMPAFSIDVTQVGTASTMLSWTAPTQNNDGSPLTDLAGYIIFYGPSSRNYTNELRIDNPGMTSVVVDGLAPGTYYFAAKAFNSASVESDYTGEVSKTLTGN
ncbi:MAG: hypothetical protein DHS20C16_37660 [Phycisphaerae bacterium]|nr:MAG: hypothetical protein DHS20C16_37660 [Phycisphaerae bacterium]